MLRTLPFVTLLPLQNVMASNFVMSESSKNAKKRKIKFGTPFEGSTCQITTGYLVFWVMRGGILGNTSVPFFILKSLKIL